MNKQIAVQTANPTVDITINKSRIKRYNKDSKVPNFYMKDGQEFQLELFNPTQDVIAAEIFLNNKRLEGGKLVLKPGQRVFLDRYLDSPKKFKFETYEVGKSKTVEQAIMYNGVVDVRFYKEITYTNPSGGLWFHPNWNNPTYTYYTKPTYTPDWTTISCDTTSDNTGANTFTTTGMVNASVQSAGMFEEPKSKKETGTVGKGSDSDQTFQNVDYNFEFSDFHRVQYQILPLSQKQTTVSDLRVKRYCTECGHTQKPNFKFCPACGSRL